MKTKIFYLLIIYFALVSCENIKDQDGPINSSKIWYSDKMLDTQAEIIDSSFNKLVEKISNYLKNRKRKFINVEYELMINNSGKVDQITIQKSLDQDIDSIVIVSVNGWKFKAGTKSGKNVNSIYPLKIRIWTDEPTISIYEPDYFVAVENMPEPIGGLKAIQEKIVYPEIAKRAGIEGKVYILAFIDENGDVVSTKILKGIGAGCDEAALYAVKQTKFKPGKQNGNSVKVQVTIPIMFKLD